ncbi:B-cell receptor CD22-like [Sinocyclocheilus anshuiensis]|uniref:B-cell receptor CD22-like n=1 Tax=Sinocyclocheilus anshuiensis TaxID=1608454 RepID=UPI0007B8EEF8|nr:PREDICTED: B-cell receptor CD22-like [Sinocyclocheilus anshuiensis]
MSRFTVPPLPLVFLLMIPGVYGQYGWDVSYSSTHICALKGSTVTMSCTFRYPTGYQIIEAFWTKTQVKEKHEEFPDLSKDPEYSQRLQYLGDKQQNCTIRLSHVTQKDEHMYCFRFITDKPDGKWLGYPGVTLTVTDLQVEAPERVTEGHNVSLTCKSSCTLTDRATFIWYRNSQPLTERRDGNNQLLLQSVRREDAGRYSCALHGHSYTSPDVQLNVRYPPVNPVISVSPSGVIVEGDSVTLSCSSDSYPPAEIRWFKGGTYLNYGETYSISNISSDHSGEYKCKSRNEHGEKYSAAVTLHVMYAPRSVSVFITGSGEILEGDSVTLICSSDSNPPALNFSWFKENQSSAVGSGQSFSALQSGRFYCEAHNQHGSQISAALSVTVLHGLRWHVWLGITVAFVGLFIIIIIVVFIIRRKRRGAKAEEATVKQDNLYSNVTEMDAYVSESAICDAAPYASISSSKPRRDGDRDAEEIQYATVQHHKNKPMKRAKESENQYDNLRIHQPAAAVRRLDVETVEEVSVIYSHVR